VSLPFFSLVSCVAKPVCASLEHGLPIQVKSLETSGRWSAQLCFVVPELDAERSMLLARTSVMPADGEAVERM